jgi:Fe-S-cluster-containing hydrogenase component 2
MDNRGIRIRLLQCDFCGSCVGVCPEDAIQLVEASLIIDFEKCTLCQRCVQVCPLGVLEVES